MTAPPTFVDQASRRGGPASPERTIGERLAEASLPPEVWRWAAAALHGDDAVDDCLAGGERPVPAPLAESGAEARNRKRSYLSRIEVQGFRGIGRAASLWFPPGPGLTVIVGRNGSGKSSFAEAAEAALTGRNLRWDAMPTAWRDGWRNLHFDDRTEITVDLHLSGDTDPTRITRTWTGESVRSARGRVVAPDGETGPLRSLGWDADLLRYRPFLSYDELGRTVHGRSAELYDTLTELLGLTGLAEAERRLARACDRLSKEETAPSRALPALADRMRTVDDPRARTAVELLDSPSIDLNRIAALAADDGPADPALQVVLRRLRRLAVPERTLMNDVVNELRGAAMELAMAAGTKGDRARGLVELLGKALEHHRRHPADTDCPTCGADSVLGAEWVRRAEREIATLKPMAAGASTAYDRAEAARDQARYLMAPPPSWLPPESDLGRLWEEWAEGAHITDLRELAAHIEDVGRRLRSAAITARKSATERLADPSDGWAAAAGDLAAWVADAHVALRARRLLLPAGQALQWLTDQARDIRAERLRPLSVQAEQVWQRLRQERYIDLEALRLVGRGAQRRVAVDVSVDNSDAEAPGANAPGLLSQGEFQALALSICLPRTLIQGNPFGFLILDDPVQAMDTETVEGLAAVLAEVGRHRQLIVFTHDTRLPDAVHRLGLAAAIRTIQRDAMSNVWVTDDTP